MGRHRRPFYRIAAFDSRTARDGRCLEVLGTYDPLVADEAKQVELKVDRVKHWIDNGALPSDTVKSIIEPTAAGDWHSVGLCSDGSYDCDAGLITSFPTRNVGGNLEIVKGVEINEFSRAKIDASIAELKEEKSMVAELLPG